MWFRFDWNLVLLNISKITKLKIKNVKNMFCNLPICLEIYKFSIKS